SLLRQVGARSYGRARTRDAGRVVESLLGRVRPFVLAGFIREICSAVAIDAWAAPSGISVFRRRGVSIASRRGVSVRGRWACIAIAPIAVIGRSEANADAESARRSAPALIIPPPLRRGRKRPRGDEARHERRNGKSSSHLHLLGGCVEAPSDAFRPGCPWGC